MSRERRFFSEQRIDGDSVVLTGAEAHHALHVVRLRPGDTALLFDGSGAEFRARLAASGSRRATFEVIARSEPDREPDIAVAVACAVPRGKRADFLVEKCCELGAAEFIPLWCARSVVDPRVRADNHLAKWRRTAVEASKQSNRTRLTEIQPPVEFADVVGMTDNYASAWICRPGCHAPDPAAPCGHGRHLLVVGPEGGFSDEEAELACHAGFAPLSLGRTVLRVETAAIAALVRLLSP